MVFIAFARVVGDLSAHSSKTELYDLVKNSLRQHRL